MEKFNKAKREECEQQRQHEKRYEPLTKVIKETKAQEVTNKEVVPFKPMIMSTPMVWKIHWANEDIPEDEFEEEQQMFEESSYLTLPSPSTPEREFFRMNRSLKQLIDLKIIHTRKNWSQILSMG